MEQEKKGPRKGAARKWSERLKKMREVPPSEELLNIIEKTEKPKKVASHRTPQRDLDV